jgi:peptide/nickel transport system substrate-binding protein
MNFAIDRNYVAQELYNGLAVPKFTTIALKPARTGRVLPRRSGNLKRNMPTTSTQANEMIAAEMEDMGATLEGGVWTFNGEPDQPHLPHPQ